MPPRKEDQIQIPEAVMNRANAAAMRGQAIADTGSIFTNRERAVDFRGTGAPSFFQEGGLPRFPFGGASSTSVDAVNRGYAADYYSDTPVGGFTRTNPNTRFESTQNQANVQYTQDAATRMANRYTLPIGAFGSPFGSRLSNFSPERAASIENRGAELNTYNPLPASPNVGAAGFSRSIDTGAGGRTEQIVSPYGFASTNLTPQQVEQRALARQQAEQMGTMPRTPEEQQALLARMRQQGSQIRERIASSARDSADTRVAAPSYTTPSGSSITAPTNMFGQPIASWQKRYEERSAINEAALAAMGRGRSTLSPLNTSILGSTGFGAMQREQDAQAPVPIRSTSLFGGMGYAAAFGGGPQPAQSMMATSPEDQRRRRIFGMG